MWHLEASACLVFVFFSVRMCNVVTNFVTTLQTKHSTSYKINETYKIIKQITSTITEPYTS